MENNKTQKNFLKWHFLEENQMAGQLKLTKKILKLQVLVIEIITGVKNIREGCIQKMMKCGLILDIL
jgi:hypothetical protein